MILNENIERRAYKKSFIQNVQLVLAYETCAWSDSLKDEVSDFLRLMGFSNKDTGSLPVIQSVRDGITIMVSSGGVVLSLENKDYQSFENFYKFLFDLFELFNIIGCERIKSFIFQKNNSYRIGDSKNKPSEDVVFAALFSDVVRDHRPMYVEPWNGCFFGVQPKYKEQDDCVIASLVLSAMCISTISIESFLEELKGVNEKLFTLWYKSTTDKVKELMER